VSAFDQQFEKNFGMAAGQGGVSPAHPDIEAKSGKAGLELDKKSTSKKMSGPEPEAPEEESKEEPAPADAAGAGCGKSKKGMFFVFLAVVGILLVAGAAAYYFLVMVSPEAILAKSAERISAIKTAEYSGTIDTAPVSGSEGVLGNTQLSVTKLTFYGSFDVSDPEKVKSAVNLGVKMDTTAGSAPSATVGFVGTDGVYYLKLDNLPTLDVIDLSIFSGQWLKIDPQKIQEELRGAYPSLMSGSESNTSGELTPQQIEQVRAAIKKYRAITVTKTLGDEIISGINCRHYTYAVNKEEAKKLINEISTIIAAGTGAPGEAGASDWLDDFDTIGGEVWLGKSDYLPYQASLTAAPAPSAAASPVTIRVTFQSFNKPVAIEAPAQSRPIEEVLMGIAAGTGTTGGGGEVTNPESGTSEGSTEPPAPSYDASRTNDMASLFAAQKSFYLANKRFYTCGTKAGDCGGKVNNFPAAIGTYLEATPVDPAGGAVCGQDLVYCGLDNSKNSKSFCYYAKLENGTFVTASPYGNFSRAAAPKTFKECQTGTLIDAASVAPEADLPSAEAPVP